MSQDLRDYQLYRVDDSDSEAGRMSVTATVGPTGHGEIDDTRGVQLTLDTPNGTAYGRLSEPQVVDLITVLMRRLNQNDADFEATRSGSGREQINQYGDVMDAL